MKVGVVQFPGSNDERDAVWALRRLGGDADLVWHGETALKGVDAVVLPGGFSYGDYLRTGAIARFAPVMAAVIEFARAGGPVLGICNGFQILCESGLLDGALTRNAGLKFVCKPVALRVETSKPTLLDAREGDTLVIPIKHGEGRYVADKDTIARLEANGQIVMRYAENPNGSADSIASVCNAEGNVMGLMPHPEHAVDAESGFGGEDGAAVLRAVLKIAARA
jgi:phosphoribosylformylglycinamidine synthase I